MLVVVFAPAALRGTTPGRWRSWPHLPSRARRRSHVAGFSTWIMVIFKPDGAHGMYSWPRFGGVDRVVHAGSSAGAEASRRRRAAEPA